MGGSTSWKRRRYSSRRRSPRRPASPSTQHLSFDHLAITTGIGYDLLLKSGWRPGAPLGQSSEGHASPVTPAGAVTPLGITVRRGRGGLGSVQRVLEEDTVHGGGLARSAPEMRRTAQRAVKFVVKGDLVFDPLRPRCQFDRNHVCRDLKMLRKHEQVCPLNPNRSGHIHGGGVSIVGNLFGELSLEGDDTEEDNSQEVELEEFSDIEDSEEMDNDDHDDDDHDDGMSTMSEDLNDIGIGLGTSV